MKLLTLNTHSLIEPDYEAKRKIFVDFIARDFFINTAETFAASCNKQRGQECHQN